MSSRNSFGEIFRVKYCPKIKTSVLYKQHRQFSKKKSCLKIESHHYALHGTATITGGSGGGPSIKLTSAQPSLLLLFVLMTALHAKNKVGRHRRRFDIRCTLMILVERVGLASPSFPPSNCQSSPSKSRPRTIFFCTATQQTHIQGKGQDKGKK